MSEPPFSEDDILGSAAYAARDEQQYEETVVAHLCSRYGLGVGARRRMSERGEGHLTLRIFHDEFPTFPTILIAKRWRQIREQCRISDLFGNFRSRKFVKEWKQARDTYSGGIDGHFGLVFYWPYLKGQLLPREGEKPAREHGGSVGLVLHDGAINWDVPGVRVVCVSPFGGRYVLEPLSVLLGEIDAECGGTWHPND